MGFTSADSALDTALIALTSTITFDESRALELADKLEQNYFAFNRKFFKAIEQLRNESNAAIESKEYGLPVLTSGIDDSIYKLWHDLRTFETNTRNVLEEYHDERARVLSQSIFDSQNLIQSIADYAVEHGSGKNCAADSET